MHRRHHQLAKRAPPIAIPTIPDVDDDDPFQDFPLPTTTRSTSTTAGNNFHGPPLPTSSTHSSSSSSSSSTTSRSTSSTVSSSTVSTSTTSTRTTSTTVQRITAAPLTSTVVVTRSSSTFSSSSASISASTSAAAGGATASGALVGGIAAAIVGIAGLVFAAVFLLRRYKRNDDFFDADNFRRESNMIPDNNNRRGPRPLTMIAERQARMATTPHSGPVTLAGPPRGYGTRSPAPFAGYSPGFQPGEIYSPTTPGSAAPLLYPSAAAAQQYAHYVDGGGYEHSPAPSPTSPWVTVDDYAPTPPPKAVHNGYLNSPFSPVGPSMSADHLVVADAVGNYDQEGVIRASVTPYQQAQYVEIARKLMPPVPQSPYSYVSGAPRAEDVGLVVGSIGSSNAPALPESPFADPTHMPGEQDEYEEEEGQDLDMPPTLSSRIASMPPSLPEIRLPNSSGRPFSPITLDTPSSYDFPVSPAVTPFSASFHHAPPAPPPPSQQQQQQQGPRPSSVYTVYDDEDAYGGM